MFFLYSILEAAGTCEGGHDFFFGRAVVDRRVRRLSVTKHLRDAPYGASFFSVLFNFFVMLEAVGVCEGLFELFSAVLLWTDAYVV